jgi:hypothetical protein
MRAYSDIITAHEPGISNVFGFVDGVFITCEDPSDSDTQNAYYNGWKSCCSITNVLVFAPDGTIVWAAYNLPGSWHDAVLARSLFERLLNSSQTPSHFALIADSAFPSNNDMIDRIITPPKVDQICACVSALPVCDPRCSSEDGHASDRFPTQQSPMCPSPMMPSTSAATVWQWQPPQVRVRLAALGFCPTADRWDERGRRGAGEVLRHRDAARETGDGWERGIRHRERLKARSQFPSETTAHSSIRGVTCSVVDTCSVDKAPALSHEGSRGLVRPRANSTTGTHSCGSSSSIH